MDRAAVSAWLDGYIRAWKSYDPRAIGDLFGEDAVYYYRPYGEPVRGRDAIVASWLEDDRDPPGTYDAHYEPVAVDGDVAVATGHSRYVEPDDPEQETEFANVFILRFDGEGRCIEYREWYFQRPEDRGAAARAE